MIHPTQQRLPGRKPPRGWTLSLRHGEHVRILRINPWIAIPTGIAFSAFAVLYLAATAYLVYRDDLLGASLSRQVAMQYDYEDRLAALRAELDRVTSSALVETKSVGSQMASVMERQQALDRRQAVLDALIDRARASGIAVAEAGASVPTPRPRPFAAAAGASEPAAAYALGYIGPEQKADHIITGTLMRPEPASTASATAESGAPEPGGGRVGSEPAEALWELRPVLRDLGSTLDAVQGKQTSALDVLLRASEAETMRVAAALGPIGLELPGGAGGPFIPADAHFVEKTATLQRRLDDLADIRRRADAMPIRAPITDAGRSSGFGSRADPFLGKPAFHSGIDFVAATGTPVHATASGTVVSAGWSGGYGNRVDIRHAQGIVTRYGHLSAILVARGDRVSAGDIVGRVGSTGRSTGAHLHYETRKDGEAVDPAPYLRVGRML